MREGDSEKYRDEDECFWLKTAVHGGVRRRFLRDWAESFRNVCVRERGFERDERGLNGKKLKGEG